MNKISFKVRQNGSSPNVAMSTATVKSEQPRVIMRDMSVQNTYTPPTAHDLDNAQLSMDKLYVNLDKAEQQSQISKEQLKKHTEAAKKLEIQLDKVRSQIKQANVSVQRFDQLKKSVRGMISIEREKITVRHQEAIRKLREKNQKLAQSLAQKRSTAPTHVPIHIVEYRNKLGAHMQKYISNPWYSLFLFVFSHHPSGTNQNAIAFMNNVPNTPVAAACREHCSQWLRSKQDVLSNSVVNKHAFLDFAVILKNVIHELKGEPKTTKEDIYKMFDISV